MTLCKTRFAGIVIMTGVIALCAACGSDNDNDTARKTDAADQTITIGWTSWADDEFMTELVKQQIESHTSFKVDKKKASIDDQYKAVAAGDIDGMLMGWLPDTHKAYWQKYHADIVDLGPMYNGAQVGWVVPDFVSKTLIGSIPDLKKRKRADKLGGTIHGIDPQSGEMKASEQAMKDYDLTDEYDLKTGDEDTMLDSLSQAMNDLQPVVVTLWTPHWAFAKWDLRFLNDPKHDFGGPQHVDAIVRKGFSKDYPEVAKFLSSLYIPLDELQKAMYEAHKTSEQKAVEKFVKSHQGLVQSWWAGTGAKVSGGGADADMDSSD